MGYQRKVKILPGEAWYGANINYGFQLPMTADSEETADTTVVRSDNQCTPLWLSSKGRYLWSEDGYLTRFQEGTITCTSKKSPILLFEGFGTLRGAYLAASKAHFPPDGTLPDERMFQSPQYCTWIHLDTKQNQQDILDFAKGILAAGMPAGELIIDDGWQTDFGDWRFKAEAFPNPKAMVEKLNAMGFQVILWICPFVSTNAPDYHYLRTGDMLVRNRFGRVAVRTWWNGKHPLLDFSNPQAVSWFQNTADGLMRQFGVAGFKQDAGDAHYYRDSDRTTGGVDANTQSFLWGESAKKYRFNELRACWKGGGWGVTQRLADKAHRWEENGLKTLVPNALLQGVSGYPFCCPDMIGGGCIGDFRGKREDEFDTELLARSAQCSALMPMMQYSFAVWKLKNKEAREACVAAAHLHKTFAPKILSLAKEAAKTGEPIIRYLDYVYPGQGLERVTDCFLLGDDVLVAPVLKKGETVRRVALPKGEWRYLPTGEVFAGGETVTVNAPLSVLPVFQLDVKE